MNDPAPVPIETCDPAHDAAQQILATVHPVCSHDLPNQMVSLHSLLHLLEMEEVDRLSNDGREYLHRLHHVAKKTATLVDFLKEAVRVLSCVPKPGRVDLREIIEELRLESRIFLDGTPTWSADLAVPAVTGDEALLHRGFNEIVKGLAGPAKLASLRWQSHADAGDTIVDLAVRYASPVPNPWTEPRPDLALGRIRFQQMRIAVVPLSASSPETAGVRFRFPSEAT
jgi:hypothetical protein